MVHAPVNAGHCPAVSIKVEPVAADAAAAANEPSSANAAAATPARIISYTDLTLAPSTAAGQAAACEGTAVSTAVQPGRWHLSVALASGVAQCERDIAAGATLTLQFTDGQPGCE